VDWPATKAHAALLAANRFGRVGDDDPALLKDLLQELDTGAMDMDLTGYSLDTREKLMTQFHVGESERLARDIASEPEYTAQDSAPDNRAKKLAKRLIDAAQLPDLGTAKAVVVSPNHHEALIIVDDALGDVLTELRRYATAGESSPLAALLSAVHQLTPPEAEVKT
jgi:hypothetical protein